MATQVFFRTDYANVQGNLTDFASPANPSGAQTGGTTAQRVITQQLATTRGAAQTNLTVSSLNGPITGGTNGVAVWRSVGSSIPVVWWITDPIDQDVTLSGSITYNLWALESSMSANAAINVRLLRWRANPAADSVATTDVIDFTGRTTELGTAAAVQNFAEAPTSHALLKGDRIIAEVYYDDAGTMSSGFTLTFSYNGPTAAANGDSYISFNETFGFLTTAPAGSTLYFTDTDLTADVTANVADHPKITPREAWTSRGAGVTSKAWNALTWPAATGISDSIGWDSHDVYVPYMCLDDQWRYGTMTQNQVVTLNVTGRREAQSIVPSDDFEVMQLWYFYATTGGVGSVYDLTIWDDNGSNRPGSNAQWQDVNAGLAFGTSYGRVFYSNSDPIDIVLSNGVKYWFEMNCTTGNALNYSSAYYNDANPLSDGHRITMSGGTWTEQTGHDLVRLMLKGCRWVEWYSKRLTAFTLADLIEVNLRMSVGSGPRNYIPRLQVAVTDADGSNPTVWGTNAGGDTDGQPQITTTETAYNFYVSGDDLAVTDGQRLRFRVAWDYPTYSNGNNVEFASNADNEFVTSTFFYNGTSGGASGDSYVRLSQSVSEFADVTATLKNTVMSFQDPALM